MNQGYGIQLHIIVHRETTTHIDGKNNNLYEDRHRFSSHFHSSSFTFRDFNLTWLFDM